MTLSVLEAQSLPPGTHHTVDFGGRRVEVWEPDQQVTGPRPLLLAHDGQNLFLPGRSFGGVPWGLNAALATLPESVVLPYVVAPWNRPDIGRAADYAPQRILQMNPDVERGFVEYFGWTEHISAGLAVQWCGDSYVKWCVDELIPEIADARSWNVNAADIAVMGSSMGGLASAYAMALRPDFFGTALCLSTHWLPGGHALAQLLTQMLPAASEGRRVWFDHGTLNLDATYGEFQLTADELMSERGYRQPNQWRTTIYEGADHNEISWSDRLPEVMRWWLNNVDQS